MQDRSQDQVIPMTEVMQLCGGRSRSWLHSHIATGAFPAGFSLGPRSRVWWKSDIIAYLECREQMNREGAVA